MHDVTGDILLSKADAIAHGVAPYDNFDQGLALAMRNQWPALYKEFRHYCHAHKAVVGGLWSWGGPGARTVLSVFTQEPSDAHGHAGHGGKAKLSSVNHALRALRLEIEREGYKSVALPRLATGVGALDWAEVKPLIAHHLGDLPVKVYIYETYKAGVAAVEPGVGG